MPRPRPATAVTGKRVPAAADQWRVNRRNLLAGALGSVAGLTALSGGSAAAASESRPKKKRVRQADGTFVQPGPYSIQASCELSEDHFLTDDVLLGNADEVLPFLNTTTGAVEAIVLADGSLAHLRRSASTTSGWSYTTIDAPFSNIISAAVVSSATHNAMIQAVATKASNGLLPACQLSLGDDGTWEVVSNGWAPDLAGPLGAGTTAAGDIYFYGWTQAAVRGNWSYAFSRWNGTGSNPGVNTGVVVTTLTFPLATSASPVAANLYLDADIGGQIASFLVVMINDIESPTDGYLIQSWRLDGSTPVAVGTDAAGASTLLWSYVSAANTSGAPAVLWQDRDGDVLFVDETNGYEPGLYDGGSVGPGQVAVFQLNGEYTFALLDDSTVNVVSQFGSGGTAQFTAGIPLVGGIERIYSVPTDPTQGTLFAVDVDQTLSVLTRDPVRGWTQTVVHQDGASLQSVTSWRTKVSVFDANGAGVGVGQIQLTTDRPVGLWQFGTSTIITPAAPVTMSTDGAGQLIVSIPTEELDVAQLSAQALDANGKPSGKPFSITPNIDVQRFLAGQGSLIDIGKLTGTALLAAENTAGDPLLPALAGPNAQNNANAVAGALSHVASLGLGYQPANPGDVQSAVFDLTGPNPTFQTATNPTALINLKGQLGETSWWNSAVHDAESAFHGLRHGVISFEKMVSSWDKNASQWVVNLVVDIGDGVKNVITYVISDIKTAIHAISSFFHSLGADLKDVWEWLKHQVVELIKNAEVSAKVIEGWLSQISDELTDIVNKIEIATDHFFSDLEADAHAAISKLEQELARATFGSEIKIPPPSNDSGSDDSDLLFNAGGDVLKFYHHISNSWLLDKIRECMPPTIGDAGPNFTADFHQVLTDLVDDAADAGAVIEDIGNTLWTAVKPALSSADDFNATTMASFFADLDQTVHDGLQLVDQVIDTLLDALKAAITCLDNLFNYQFQDIPLIGDLLNLAGIDSTLTISHLTSLIVAYPATLLNQIVNPKSPLFPAITAQAARAPARRIGSSGIDPWAIGLNWTSAVVQAVWATNDGYQDAVIAAGESPYAPPFKANALMVSLDIVCPIVLNILQWPSAALPNGKTAYPFYGGVNSSGPWTNLIPSMIMTEFLPPLCGWISVGLQGGGFAVSDPWNDVLSPACQTCAGIANTVLSSIYGQGQGWNPALITSGVVGNLSYDISLLGLPELAEATEDATAIAKLIIDAIGNYGAVLFYAEAAIAANIP